MASPTSFLCLNISFHGYISHKDQSLKSKTQHHEEKVWNPSSTQTDLCCCYEGLHSPLAMGSILSSLTALLHMIKRYRTDSGVWGKKNSLHDELESDLSTWSIGQGRRWVWYSTQAPHSKHSSDDRYNGRYRHNLELPGGEPQWEMCLDFVNWHEKININMDTWLHGA